MFNTLFFQNVTAIRTLNGTASIYDVNRIGAGTKLQCNFTNLQC